MLIITFLANLFNVWKWKPCVSYKSPESGIIAHIGYGLHVRTLNSSTEATFDLLCNELCVFGTSMSYYDAFVCKTGHSQSILIKHCIFFSNLCICNSSSKYRAWQKCLSTSALGPCRYDMMNRSGHTLALILAFPHSFLAFIAMGPLQKKFTITQNGLLWFWKGTKVMLLTSLDPNWLLFFVKDNRKIKCIQIFLYKNILYRYD